MLLGLSLVALAAASIGMRIGKGLREQRFQSATQRLWSELQGCRKLAIHMQADWSLTLERRPNQWILHKNCPEWGKETHAIWPADADFYFNGQRLDALCIRLSASGHISPSGSLTLKSREKSIVWELPGCFGVEAGSFKIDFVK